MLEVERYHFLTSRVKMKIMKDIDNSNYHFNYAGQYSPLALSEDVATKIKVLYLTI